MNISLIKALKSPFEKRFLIPCIIWAIMVVWAYTHMQITKGLPIIKNISTALYIASLMTMIGYFSSFSYNTIQGQKKLFNIPLYLLFTNGIKTFLCTLCFYPIVYVSETLAVFSLKYLPFGIDLFTFIFIQSLMFLYLLTAWSQFIVTLHITEPLRIVKNLKILNQNWPMYFKVTLYIIVAILILTIPISIIRLSILFLAKNYSWAPYIGIFIAAFAYLYPVFVVLHIIAQGSNIIKNKNKEIHPKKKLSKVEKEKKSIKKVK